jgi:hypothetical protein
MMLDNKTILFIIQQCLESFGIHRFLTEELRQVIDQQFEIIPAY